MLFQHKLGRCSVLSQWSPKKPGMQSQISQTEQRRTWFSFSPKLDSLVRLSPLDPEPRPLPLQLRDWEETYEQGSCYPCSSLKLWDVFGQWFHAGCFAAWKHQDLGLLSSAQGIEWGVCGFAFCNSYHWEHLPSFTTLSCPSLIYSLLSSLAPVGSPIATSICTTVFLLSCFSSNSLGFFFPPPFYVTVIYDPEFKDLLQCADDMADSVSDVFSLVIILLNPIFFHSETTCITLSRLSSSKLLRLFTWE